MSNNAKYKSMSNIMSSVKSRRAIAGTINKFQISTITSRGHFISGTAVPTANDATPQLCAAYKRRRRSNIMRVLQECSINQKKVQILFQHWKGTRWRAYLRHVMLDPREHIGPNTFLKYHAIQYYIGLALSLLSMVKNHFIH